MSTGIPIISTGNAGLDDVLRGGLPAHRLYLIEGTPGAGKTTLSLEFLRAGAMAGEAALYITLSETKEELAAVAYSHGWRLDEFSVLELSAVEQELGLEREQSILHPWELELGETVRMIKAEVERVKPKRLVLDSLSEMRLLAHDPLRYRRQVLALKQYFAALEMTVLMVDDMTGSHAGFDTHLHSLCHGVITLERVTLDFGPARRRLHVRKLRSIDFLAGYHDFVIRRGGLDVYPRLVASEHAADYVPEPVTSGLPGLDRLMNGGPVRGTCMLISGPSGTGKTTLGLQYLYSACERGEPCTLYEFDERIGTLMIRAEAFGMDLRKYVDSGLLLIEQVDPAGVSPGEFAQRVRRQVTHRHTRLIAIDSLNGYLAAMPQEHHLLLQMHELLAFLSHQGVFALLINPHQGLLSAAKGPSPDISYIADSVVSLRFFEADGRIRKAISIVKNRSGAHEDAIREFRIDAKGLRVGEPLTGFRGVLTGTPEYTGRQQPLLEDRQHDA